MPCELGTTRSLQPLASALLVVLGTVNASADDNRDGNAFFEEHIRPVLVRHCYECHSGESEIPQGGLRLDSRSHLRRGGDSGPILVPGKPGESELLKALRWESLEMPPDGRLPDEVTNVVEQWILMGAPDPREDAAGGEPTRGISIEEARDLWSFQPPRRHKIPVLQQPARAPIDHFIRSQLEEKGLSPAPPTSRYSLIRRVYFDLIGLPPTHEEVEQFLADDSIAPFARVVDRLLASPRFGERWGRYWLDIARYADAGAQNRRFPYAFGYRDWVIDALNEDLAYDDFVRYQLAADQLPLDQDRRHLAALGLLALGTDLPRATDVPENIDDRIDVVTRGFLGLTVSCARCHDHKFDAIPTRDYYSLYGVFLNSKPALEPVRSTTAYQRHGWDDFYERRLKERSKAIDDFRRERLAEHIAEFRTSGQLQRYLASAWESRNASNTELQQTARQGDLNLYLLRRWRDYLAAVVKRGDAVFRPWLKFAELPRDTATPQDLPQLLRERLAHGRPESVTELAAIYGEVLAKVSRPEPYADSELEQLRQVLWGDGTPTEIPFKDFWWIQNEGDSNVVKTLRWQYNGVFSDYAFRGVGPHAMVVQDAAEMQQAYVFRRGNQHDRGTEVPRRFLTALAGGDAAPFQHGSGRLDLANAIASRENPLTARVIVNRVWQHLFGQGLVRTPSDFGVRGTPPSHPELLDHLAVQFVEQGWSLKSLIRRIVLSTTYRQSSRAGMVARQSDPENRQLSHMNRRRHDFEALRDSMLFVAGRLESRVGGPPFMLGSIPAAPRRSVYAFIDRERIEGLLKSFDFSDPEQHTSQRHTTTVPQQALFLMNSPFVTEQCRHVLQRIRASEPPRDRHREVNRIRALYRLLLAREPTPNEIDLGRNFLQSRQNTANRKREARTPSSTAWKYGYGKLNRDAGRMESFTEFRHFTGTSWQSDSILPSPESGRASLSRSGGSPGDDLDAAVVRRWTAPRSGAIDVRGELSHRMGGTGRRFDHSNGIRGWVLSNRQGMLGSWQLRDQAADTSLVGVSVEAGERIDFVVDARDDYEEDRFSWAPSIEMSDDQTPRRWDARSDFAGPEVEPLTDWEEYIQVLLLTNEFVFVD